jgi:hypothetical protein
VDEGIGEQIARDPAGVFFAQVAAAQEILDGRKHRVRGIERAVEDIFHQHLRRPAHVVRNAGLEAHFDQPIEAGRRQSPDAGSGYDRVGEGLPHGADLGFAERNVHLVDVARETAPDRAMQGPPGARGGGPPARIGDAAFQTDFYTYSHGTLPRKRRFRLNGGNAACR